MFVGCEANATMVTVDLANRNVIDHHGVGETPDVLAYDPGTNRVYVAAESGWVSIFDQDHSHLTVRGSAYLAHGAWLWTPRRTTATFRSPRITTVHPCCGSTSPPEVPAPRPERLAPKGARGTAGEDYVVALYFLGRRGEQQRTRRGARAEPVHRQPRRRQLSDTGARGPDRPQSTGNPPYSLRSYWSR